MLKRQKRLKGFTAIELMTVIVIIGVIVAIGVANYVTSSKKRALEASLLSNMRILQVMLETYKVDYQAYPESLVVLGTEASNKNYNKSVSNPYTRQSGFVGSTNIWSIDYLDPSDASFSGSKSLYLGRVGYQWISSSKYYLLGYDGDGVPIQRNGTPYTVSNG